MEGTSPDQAVDSVATILEQETQATINDWFQRNMANNLLVSSPLEESVRTSHLPELFRDLVNRLRYPLPARALVSPGAAAHGLLRRKQGYTAAMLVEESRMLEVSIFHTLHANANRIDFSVLLPDVVVIADEVDSQLAQAMASYAAVCCERRRVQWRISLQNDAKQPPYQVSRLWCFRFLRLAAEGKGRISDAVKGLAVEFALPTQQGKRL
jgi:hypothetical protein